MSRSNREPTVASLRKVGTASLPEMVKPEMDGEATNKRTHSVPRGSVGQRAENDRSRNLGYPAECWYQQRRGGMNNPASDSGRESDRPIVARKRVTTVEREGLTVEASL